MIMLVATIHSDVSTLSSTDAHLRMHPINDTISIVKGLTVFIFRTQVLVAPPHLDYDRIDINIWGALSPYL